MSTLVYTRRVSQTAVGATQTKSNAATSSSSDRLMELMRDTYLADHQVKFLHLQAEADCLLQQLMSLKQQRQNALGSEPPQV